MNQEIPRRIRIDLFTPEEKALYEMVGKIEELGAHPLLTDCVVLLGEARSKLSDWVDLQEAEAKSEAFAGVIKMVGNSTNETAEQVRAADLSPRERIPLNQLIPTEGGAFFVHWSCSNCLPDDYDSSDTCHNCGKPRTVKPESR